MRRRRRAVLNTEIIDGVDLFFEKRDFGQGLEVAMWQHKPNCAACLIGYFDTKTEAINWFKKYGEQPIKQHLLL